MIGHVSNIHKFYTIFFLTVSFLTSCDGCSNNGEADPEPITAIEAATQTSTSSVISTASGASLVSDHSLSRLSPEQYYLLIKHGLNYDLEWLNSDGIAVNDNMLVALGGVDFSSAHQRDAIPRVSTALIIRSVAWQVADAVVWRDESFEVGHASAPDTKQVFTKVTLTEDRPLNAADASLAPEELQTAQQREERWFQQLNDLYLRLYGRNAADSERQMMKSAFNQMLESENYPPAAWRGLLFAMLASAEALYR